MDSGQTYNVLGMLFIVSYRIGGYALAQTVENNPGPELAYDFNLEPPPPPEQRVSARTRDFANQKDELHATTESLRSTNRENEELLLRLQQETLEDGLTGLL